MDIQTLKAKLDIERSLEVTLEGATFKLKMPSDHIWRMSYERNTVGRNTIYVAAGREVLNMAIVGWSGLTAGHFRVEPASDAVEFSPDFRSEFLDCRTDLADQLLDRLSDHRAERAKILESERKNLLSAPSGI
jgi:hypothetical protein